MSFNNQFAQRIYNLLALLIGPLMAESAVRIQAKKAGATPDTIGPAHLPLIAQEVEKAIRIFVGSEKAREVSAVIAGLHNVSSESVH